MKKIDWINALIEHLQLEKKNSGYHIILGHAQLTLAVIFFVPNFQRVLISY